MIDYKKHRERLEEYADIKDMWENRDDYPHIKYKQMTDAEKKYHDGILSDAAELLDKAERWDRYSKGESNGGEK